MTTPTERKALHLALDHAINHGADPGICLHTKDQRFALSLIALLGLDDNNRTVFPKTDECNAFIVWQKGNTKIFLSGPLTNLLPDEQEGSSVIEDVLR